MTSAAQTPNRILDGLPAADAEAVLRAGARVAFKTGETLIEPDAPIRWAYFVETGVISALSEMRNGRSVEAYMVGCEGLSGAPAAQAPARLQSRHVCQVEGEALRIDAERLRRLADERPALRQAIIGYMTALQAELEQSAACNALHPPRRRFAKWLLRCHDRVDGDILHLTHEHLASMLGAQRTTVSEAAQALQQAGAIRSSRGQVRIIDRAALEAAACECYRGFGPAAALRSPD